MQRSLIGILVGIVLAIGLMAGRGSSPSALAAPSDSTPSRATSTLVTHVVAPDGQPEIVTVVDPEVRVMAVYHVDRSTGEIALKSVRNLTFDLQMVEFNTGQPLPHEIREMRGGLQR